MVEPQDARDMLDRAERAAMAGDLASADELLRAAARFQEEELGPVHPDLANTLNNLAVVAERTGRPSEAEALYRRAAAIATASLPSDHPTVVESRQNLEDFCRAHGLPIAPQPVITPPEDIKPRSNIIAAEPPSNTRTASTPVSPAKTAVATKAAPPPSAAPGPDAEPHMPVAPPRAPAAPSTASHSFAWTAGGVVLLVVVVFLLLRPGTPRESSKPVPASEPAAVPPTEAPPPVAPPPARSAPTESAKSAGPGHDQNVTTNEPPAGAPAAVTLATAQLCRSFSASGRSWRCVEVGDSVPPGPVVFYTRVRSSRNGAVVLRWYRGDTLRQSARLAIRASPTEGYRTYGRQTVNGGDWRVELRTANGSLLHEQRFTVR